jgi:hypothetical protein
MHCKIFIRNTRDSCLGTLWRELMLRFFPPSKIEGEALKSVSIVFSCAYIKKEPFCYHFTGYYSALL